MGVVVGAHGVRVMFGSAAGGVVGAVVARVGKLPPRIYKWADKSSAMYVGLWWWTHARGTTMSATPLGTLLTRFLILLKPLAHCAYDAVVWRGGACCGGNGWPHRKRKCPQIDIERGPLSDGNAFSNAVSRTQHAKHQKRGNHSIQL